MNRSAKSTVMTRTSRFQHVFGTSRKGALVNNSFWTANSSFWVWSLERFDTYDFRVFKFARVPTQTHRKIVGGKEHNRRHFLPYRGIPFVSFVRQSKGYAQASAYLFYGTAKASVWTKKFMTRSAFPCSHLGSPWAVIRPTVLIAALLSLDVAVPCRVMLFFSHPCTLAYCVASIIISWHLASLSELAYLKRHELSYLSNHALTLLLHRLQSGHQL